MKHRSSTAGYCIPQRSHAISRVLQLREVREAFAATKDDLLFRTFKAISDRFSAGSKGPKVDQRRVVFQGEALVRVSRLSVLLCLRLCVSIAYLSSCSRFVMLYPKHLPAVHVC